MPGPISLQSPNTLLKKLLNTKGHDSLEDIADTYLPVIVLDQLREDWEALRGTSLCIGRVLTGALAANNTASGLRPAAGLSRIVTVYGFWSRPSAGVLDVRYRSPQSASGVIATPTLFRTDLRQLLQGPVLLPSPSTFGLSVQLGAVTGTGPLLVMEAVPVAQQGGVPYYDFGRCPVIMDGNSELLVWNLTQLTAVDVTFLFSERNVEGSETVAT